MSNEKQQIDSLNALVGGVRLAQSRGTYSLEEAYDLCAAVKTFTDPPQAVPESIDDVTTAKRKSGRSKNS